MPNDVQRGNDANLCALAEGISTLPNRIFLLCCDKASVLFGHFLRGYGDSQKPQAELELLPGAVGEAPAFLSGKTKSRGVALKLAPDWNRGNIARYTSKPLTRSISLISRYIIQRSTQTRDPQCQDRKVFAFTNSRNICSGLMALDLAPFWLIREYGFWEGRVYIGAG